jgi:hypothetical protein
MVVPLLLVWPPSTPVGEQSRRLFEYWIKPENASRLTKISLLSAKLWPPAPVIFGIFGVLLVKGLYKKCYSYLYWRVSGTKLPQPRPVCALSEGAKRIGDLGRAIWILAEMVRGGKEGGDPNKVDAEIDDEVTMHIFNTYAAYTPPYVRAPTLVEDNGYG